MIRVRLRFPLKCWNQRVPLGETHLIAVGAFIDQAQAQGVVEKLLTPLGLAARVTRNAQMRYRLELGPIAAGAELERLTALLTTMDLGDITIARSSFALAGANVRLAA